MGKFDNIYGDLDKMNNKFEKTSRQIKEEVVNILLEAIKPYEEQIKVDIKEYWLKWFDKFMAESTQYCPADSMRKDLNMSSMNKSYYEHPYYLLANLGIYKESVERPLRYSCTSKNNPVEYYKNKLSRAIDILSDERITNSRYKLLEAVLKHFDAQQIDSVEVVHTTLGRKGLEGIYRINLIDGTQKLLHTTAIYAGGYNIQKLHIRYLVRVV